MIAIGSAETYRALQTRTNDLLESPEYQTVTSDVLKVVSAPPAGLAARESTERHPAAQRHRLSGHVSIADQHQNHLRDFFGRAEPSDRNA